MDNKKIIRMRPEDSSSLFWDEEGVCIGGAESLTLHDSSDDENGTTIELHIPGLQEWLDEYMWQCLVPCESGTISIEELNKSFNWKKFHKRGTALALEVKKLLPPEISLLYAPPFEDKSGIMHQNTEIEDWKWCLVGNIVREREYGENHEIRIGTKHFSPETKIYCAPGHWGDGYENIAVIGKQRGNPKYIEIIMPRRFIENFRCQKVFRPAVLRLMNKSHWGFWSNSDSDKKAITEMAEGLNDPESGWW